MVTSINLGNIINVNGKTVSTGGASGLDVQGIVDGLVKVRQAQADKVSDSIKLNSSKITEISSYRTLLANFKTVNDFLKNPAGVNTASTNTFEYRRVSATSSNGAAAANYLSVSASAGATLGNYEIEVDNLAVARSNISQAYTSRTGSLVTLTGAGGTPKAGTFSLGGQNITLEVGDTLETIVSKINSTTALSKVKADIIKVGDSDFRLKITATQTGVANAYAVAGDTTVFDSMFTGGLSIATGAENAELTIGGIQIIRATNTIGDAIDGVSFTLYQETDVAQKLNVGITSDPDAVASKIQEFVDAYNNIKTFIAKQQQRDADNKLLDTAILGEDDILNNFADSALSELGAAVSGLDADIKRLGDIGLTFTDYAGDAENPQVRNVLQLDTAKLQTVLDSNFDDVRKVFEFQLTSNAPDKLGIYSRDNTMGVTEFQLDVDLTRGVSDRVRAIYTDSEGNTQTINMDYDFADQASVTTKSIGDTIFGVNTAVSAFTGLADGDSFRMTVNKADGTTTDYDFVFKAVPVAANEFSNFNELRAAMDAVTDVTAAASTGGVFKITPDNQFDTLTFTNLGAPDFITALGLSDTDLPSGTLTGQDGTVLEGLTLVYVPNGSDGTDVIDVSFTQGIADRISNVLSNYLTEGTGFLDLDVASINDDTTSLKDDLADKNEDITSYRDKLYGQFSGLEAAITKINSLLLFLDAQDKARNNSN